MQYIVILNRGRPHRAKSVRVVTLPAPIFFSAPKNPIRLRDEHVANLNTPPVPTARLARRTDFLHKN